MSSKPFQLIYWPIGHGRGDFVRIMFESVGQTYDYITDLKDVTDLIDPDKQLAKKSVVFAPPVLVHNGHIIPQTGVIMAYLGPILKLAPEEPAAQADIASVNQTILDCTNEAHEAHHPISTNLRYEDQKDAAALRTRDFMKNRIPKFLSYLDRKIQVNGHESFLCGDKLTYADLSLFTLVEGLKFAFPEVMKTYLPQYKNVEKLHAHVTSLEKIKDYLTSDRISKDNNDGIFRHYPELDKSDQTA